MAGKKRCPDRHEAAALGRRLRDAREYLGFTQQQVADAVQVHRNTIVNIEAGNHDVSAETFQALAKLYGYPTSYFLDNGEPMDLPRNIDTTKLPLEDVDELKKFAEFLRYRKQRGAAGPANAES